MASTDQTQNPFNPIVWYILLIIGVFSYGSYSVLMHLSEKDGKIPFSSSSVVFMTEFTKLLFSLGLSTSELKRSGRFHHLNLHTCLPFSIPAALYCVNNNIAVHMQMQMDPATFQILSNLKILTTALLYRLIIQRPITYVQWLSLILLTIAGVSHSYGGLQDKENVKQDVFITWQGLSMMLMYCIFSALAGVYSEYILKRHKQLSLAVQNMILYIFGVMLNGFLYILSGESQGQYYFLYIFYTVDSA